MPLLQLKIIDWHNEEKASDALSIHGYEHYHADDYALEACYLASNSLHTGAARASSQQPSKDFTKWWHDGDEPQYYLVSPKVRPPIAVHPACACEAQAAIPKSSRLSLDLSPTP